MFNRRLITFLVLVGGLMLIILARLAQLQLRYGDHYAAEAEKSMRYVRSLATHRGDILDRNGRTLATDLACSEFRMDFRALLVDRVRRDTRRLMEQEGLSADRAQRRVEQRLDEIGELELLVRWMGRRARVIARDERIGEDQAMELLVTRVAATIDRAAAVAGVSRSVLESNADTVIDRVSTWRRRVGTLLAEEVASHAVLDGLDDRTASLLRDEAPNMIGASVGPSTMRDYPYGDIACHVIGRVGRVSREVLDADPEPDDPLRRYLPDETVGMSGVERLCERTLRGRRGLLERRVTGEVLAHVEPVGGRDVRLTIDIELQEQLTALMRGYDEQRGIRAGMYNGAAVVIDVPTGDILAMVSTPTYDLNTYSADYRALVADHENFPLLNRAVARAYPPGSTMKPITAVTALSRRIIAPGTQFTCHGHDDSRKPRCWFKSGHGTIALSEAMMNSCNAYFTALADLLGPDRLTAGMREFGLGAAPGTGLPGETAGVVPDLDWLGRRYGRSWWPSDGRFMSIGQGLVLASPLQVVNAIAAIARDGLYRPAVLIREIDAAPIGRQLDISMAHLHVVQEGMCRVVNDPASQTAYKYARHPAVTVCGKTGTAQTERPGRSMAWFVGYAPRERPRVAFAFVLDYVEPGEGGGKTAGPLAPALIDILLALGYLQ